MMTSEETIKRDKLIIDTLETRLTQALAENTATKQENTQFRALFTTFMSMPEFGLMLQRHAGAMQQIPLFPPTQPMQPEVFAMPSTSPPNLQATTPVSFTGVPDLDSLVNLEDYDDDVEDENTDGQRKKRLKSM
jgi:hypothetical protein